VYGPSRDGDRTEYAAIAQAEQLGLGGDMTGLSLKQLFLPATEALLRFKQKKNDVEVEEVPTKPGPRVVLGARPCDAAGIEVVDRLMGWDYRDELWFGRREATTIVTLACPGVDAACFCTAVGLGPDTTRGADATMVPVEGGYLFEALSAKGEALVAQHAKRFAEPPARAVEAAAEVRSKARRKVEGNLTVSTEKIRAWLGDNFEHEYWRTIALRCHGCGACAAVCPTCHCFDIVDEPARYAHGTRRRNWDFCQTGKFTLHASGHNPRGDQHARYRQRVMHKFRVYPERFGEILCTGCGRCVRACPASMDLLEVLAQIGRLAEGSVAVAQGGAR
jgi:ferredoxin